MLRLRAVAAAVAIGGVLQSAAPGSAPPPPRTAARSALRAVEGDSGVTLAGRWNSALSRDPHDRSAALGLATLARLQYQYDDADRRYQQLIVAPAAGPDAVSTYARLGYAWGLDIRGLAARADTAFSAARTEARVRHDRTAEAEALIGLSINRGSQQGIPVGLALLDTAARLVPGDAPDLVADIASRRALFVTVLSRPTAYRDALAAATLAHQAGEPRLEARALRNLALGLALRELFDSSAAVLDQVERMEREVHDRAMLAETLMRHADTFHNQGAIGPYKQYVLAARDEAVASGNLYALAASNIALGSLSLLLNDDAAAGQYLTVAGAQYDSMQDKSGFALVHAYQADLAADIGDLARARKLAEETRDFDHRVGDAAAELEELRDLIQINVRAGDTAAAARALAAAEALARRRHRPAWDASLDPDRARLDLARADAGAAVLALTRYLRGLDSAEHVSRYTGRALLADAETRNGQLWRAELELTAAADDLDEWRNTITDRVLRPYLFQMGSREVNDRDASTATVIAAMTEGGRAEAAFALAERRRARDLADRLIRLAALKSDRDTNAASASRENVATGTGKVLVRPANGRGAADSVAAALPDTHTAFLEFVTGAYGAPTTLFILARPTDGAVGAAAVLRAVVLPSADSLAPQIGRFLALIESGRDAGPVARSLGSATLDSALALLGPDITHLIIVPDGPLYRVPFDALRTSDGTTIVARYVVSTTPSAAVLRALWRQNLSPLHDSAGVQLLALADPTFARAGGPVSSMLAAARSASNAYRDSFDSTGGLPRLAESGREARLVARYATTAEIRVGRDATADYLLHAPLERFRVIHIATHALVDDRSIARTALALAPSERETGFVTPSQLAALHLHADLVMLSACRTAGGVVVDGDGVQGLTGPLLAAGARSVVATQWRIRDRATVPFVEDFYAALARGLPVGDALRAAKLDAIKRGAPTADWAAFTVVGDPLARVPLKRPANAQGRLLAWAVVLFASLVVIVAGARLASSLARRNTTGYAKKKDLR